MHVYCTDGTVFECGRYEVNEFGLVLYGQPEPESADRYDSTDDTQIGFVPHDRLWYVLPRGVTPQTGLAPSQGQGTPGRPAGQGQQPQGQQPQKQQPQKQQPQGRPTDQASGSAGRPAGQAQESPGRPTDGR